MAIVPRGGKRGLGLVFLGVLGQLLCLAESERASESLVVEAQKKNLTQILESVPEGAHVLFEFYAHWCPHCKHFKPTYEEVGTFFMKLPKVKPEVFVMRIDCAIKENQETCSDYGVTGYPTVHFGLPKQFLDKDLTNLQQVKARKTPLIVKAIGDILGVDFKFDDGSAKGSTTPTVKTNEGVRKETHRAVHLGDMERATVEIFDHILSNRALLQNEAQRKGLLDFLTLLSVAHPSTRCQMSAQHLASKFDEMWPENQERPTEEFRKFRMCTNQFKMMEWATCKGSLPNSRGFTCGVWSLMHSMAARVPETNGAKTWHAGMSGFIQNFFGCKVCADHFYELLQTPDALGMTTRKDVALWLWRVHNQVNARLAKEEAKDGTGDPDFPKIQWPSKEQCPLCAVPGADASQKNWNSEEVHIFLINFYQDPAPLPVQRERWSGSGQDGGDVEGIAVPSEKDKVRNVALGRKALDPDTLAIGSEDSLKKFSQGEKKEVIEESRVGLAPVACIAIVLVVMFTLRGRFNKSKRTVNTKHV
ncbi:hypothetical protein BSKO_08021 [Bryopsis sp. KO-2023]|nr:hypothetical protein BSKO_08021 [Bryopsis sp. KO-2023]